jgi:hypothetical protein
MLATMVLLMFEAIPAFCRRVICRMVFSVVLTLGISLSICTPSHAQELGAVLRGDMGLKSGTQPGPGYYFSFLYYNASYDSVRGPNGGVLPGKVNTSLDLLVPIVTVTTKWKLLGGYYGFSVAIPFSNQALASTFVPLSKGNTYGFGDMYFQPLTLGWHKKHADYLVGYGFYAPTGNGIRSLDMWTQRMSFGTTYYLDEGKKWSVAGNAALEIHAVKRSTDILVGDFLTIKGGVGRSFLKGAASAGLVYCLQYKITHDGGTGLPALLPNSLNKAYALGPEVNFPFFVKEKTVGFIGARYTWEFNNSSNFQGNNLALTLTLAKFD